jgi:hypothetical protein
VFPSVLVKTVEEYGVEVEVEVEVAGKFECEIEEGSDEDKAIPSTLKCILILLDP